MRKMKQLLALLLVATLTVGSIAGCTQTGGEESSGTKAESTVSGDTSDEASDTDAEADEEPAIKATTVSYSKSGKYTTTVTSSEVDLSGIKAENVEVRYMDFSSFGTSEEETDAVDSTEGSSEEAAESGKEEEESVEEISFDELKEKYYTLTTKVESVEKNGDGWDITFTDEKAAEEKTPFYTIFFNDIKNGASLMVDFPEISLTPDVEYVAVSSKDFKVSFTAEGGEFVDDISMDDISLSGNFKGMDAEIISSSKNNLTLQFKGDIVPNEANAYQWGTVTVDSSAFEGDYMDAYGIVDIEFLGGYLDGSTLKYNDGKATVNYKTFASKADELNKDNIKLDGVTVEAVEKVDDETAALTLSAYGVKSANEFADLVSDKEIEVNGITSGTDLAQAGFYPVFDYVEDDGENLKLTLKVYSFRGSVKDLKAEQVSFADDFEGAKVESIEPEEGNDTLATMVISVPANGKTADDLRLNGTITLAAGALTNLWSDKTTVEVTSTRDYSNSSLGRFDADEGWIDFDNISDISDAISKAGSGSAEATNIMLNPETLLEIQSYVRGTNTGIGQVFYYGQLGMQIVNFVIKLAEMSGAIESEHAEEMRVLNEINTKLDRVLEGVSAIQGELDEAKIAILRDRLGDYDGYIRNIESDISRIKNMIKNAKLDLSKQDPLKYKNALKNASNEEVAAYFHDVVEYMSKKSSENKGDTNYGGYIDLREDLTNNFMDLTNLLAKDGMDNPINLVDQICSYEFNFDSQAYSERMAQRVAAQKIIAQTFSLLSICYDYPNDPQNANMRSVTNNMRNALSTLDAMSFVGYTPKQIKEHQFKGMISEIRLSVDKTAEKAKKHLTDNSFTVIDNNLGTGTDNYIYIGVKYTTDSSQAQKALKIVKGKAESIDNFARIETFDQGKRVTGDQEGNINYGSTGEDEIHIYCSNKSEFGEPITSITIDSTSGDSVGDCNILESRKTDEKLYLHTSGIYFEYAPFCYLLNRRIAFAYSHDRNSFNKLYALKGANHDLVSNTYLNWDAGCYRKNTKDLFAGRFKGKTLIQHLNAAGIYPDKDWHLVTELWWEKKEPGWLSTSSVVKYYLYSNNIHQSSTSVETNRKMALYKVDHNGTTKDTDRYVQFIYTLLLPENSSDTYDFSKPNLYDKGYNTYKDDETDRTYTFNKDGTGVVNGKKFTYTTKKETDGTITLNLTINGNTTTYEDCYILSDTDSKGNVTRTFVMLDDDLETHTFTCIEKLTDSDVYDSYFYFNRYKDLQKMDSDALYYHWQKNGLKENRSSTPGFDIGYYLENNPDVKAKFGDDKNAAYEYFLTEGYRQKDGKFSIFYDAAYYASHHPELSNLTSGQRFIHYITIGVKTGERASAAFDPEFYKSNYSDLKFDDMEFYFVHYLLRGIKEGRSGSAY